MKYRRCSQHDEYVEALIKLGPNAIKALELNRAWMMTMGHGPHGWRAVEDDVAESLGIQRNSDVTWPHEIE